jgi:hypothetical protein
MDTTDAPGSDPRALTPEELEGIAAGYDVYVIDQGNGTWLVATLDGSVVGTYPDRGMAGELALYLNDPRSNPKPHWWH